MSQNLLLLLLPVRTYGRVVATETNQALQLSILDPIFPFPM